MMAGGGPTFFVRHVRTRSERRGTVRETRGEIQYEPLRRRTEPPDTVRFAHAHMDLSEFPKLSAALVLRRLSSDRRGAVKTVFGQIT